MLIYYGGFHDDAVDRHGFPLFLFSSNDFLPSPLFFYHFSLFILHQKGEGGKREMRGGRNSIGKREGGEPISPRVDFYAYPTHLPSLSSFTVQKAWDSPASLHSYLTTTFSHFYYENTNFPAKSSTFSPLQKLKYWSKISCCKFQPE